jgi:hypothetical protein
MHAKAVHPPLQKQKADVSRGTVSFSRDEEGTRDIGEENKQQQQ